MSRVLVCMLVVSCSLWAADGPAAPAAQDLANVKRIYVSLLTGGENALEIRDLLMSSLQITKAFIITEDEDRADAVLRGAAKDQVFNEQHESSDSINAHTQIGGGSTGTTKSNGPRYAGVTIGEHENHRSQERKHEAMLTVRLVNRDGDVIWSATAESQGGKFLGASADVADKIAKELVDDYKKAKAPAGLPKPATLGP